MNLRERASSFRQKLHHYRERYYSYELLALMLVALYAYLDQRIIQQFSDFTREQVISAISGLFVTVEGVLIGLAPQIRTKWLRTLVGGVIGIPAILSSIGTFATATYQSIQLGYSSFSPTTFQFQISSILFFGFIEFYALALLFPFTPIKHDPTETEP